MTLNPAHRPVPERFDALGFVLRRQQRSDNALDYRAVMDSRLLLRIWSDSSWPEDDFTLEQNAEDLAGHISDFDQHEAYGFSIFTPSQDRLLGSLYLESVAPFLEGYQADDVTRARLGQYDVRVEYWLRRGIDEAFELTFLTEIMGWLEHSWWFSRAAFGSRRGMLVRRDCYQKAGLVSAVTLHSHDGARQFHFHARPEGRS